MIFLPWLLLLLVRVVARIKSNCNHIVVGPALLRRFLRFVPFSIPITDAVGNNES
jgi:hypothetical protein